MFHRSPASIATIAADSFATIAGLRVRLLLDGRALSLVSAFRPKWDGPCDVLARARGRRTTRSARLRDHLVFMMLRRRLPYA